MTDETLFGMKGKHPIVPLNQRLAIVEAIGIVEQAVVDHSAYKVEVWQDVRFALARAHGRVEGSLHVER